MQILIGSDDRYLSENLGRVVEQTGRRAIRTNTVERLIQELKKPERLAIIDVNWEAMQEAGVLKRLVNISRISGNRVVCMCPNTDEDLKKLATRSRADQVFIRYDIETTFKDYLRTV